DAVFVAGLAGGTALPILAASERERVRRIEADVRSQSQVEAAVHESRPDLIFHLAGISFPPEAEQHPETTREVNVGGVVHLLDAVVAQELDPTVVVVGSGVQYGRHEPSEMPLAETAELRPT